MSLYEFEIANFEEQYGKLKLKHEETKLESIKLQRGHLETLQKHHIMWAQSSEDPERAKIHFCIADLLKQTHDQFDRLLVSKNQGSH